MDESNAFGAWLKDQRRLLDITQEEMAGRIGCNYDYIRKIESGNRRASKAMAKLLHEHLGLPQEDLEEFIRFAREGAVRGVPAPASRNGKVPHHPGDVEAEPDLPPTNLPSQRTHFIGREEQVSRVRELLQSER